MDLELEACHEAVLHFQKALADAKLFHKGLAAKVSSLALDASERYLIMQVSTLLTSKSYQSWDMTKVGNCLVGIWP